MRENRDDIEPQLVLPRPLRALGAGPIQFHETVWRINLAAPCRHIDQDTDRVDLRYLYLIAIVTENQALRALALFDVRHHTEMVTLDGLDPAPDQFVTVVLPWR